MYNILYGIKKIHIMNIIIAFSITSCVYADVLKLGIECVSSALLCELEFKLDEPITCGLITNHTGKDQAGRRSVDILLQQGLHISYLLAPEHGFNGVVAAGVAVTDTVDEKTGIKIMSLYKHGTSREINTDIMDKVDLLLFDMQDVGMRHYTYIATMLYAMQSAALHNKPFVVFDRPNPLGHRIEGPVVHEVIPGSMIAAAPIPLRHGMTVGELAYFFNRYVLSKPVHLHVVKMENYTRTAVPEKLLQNVSPNIQSARSCYGYSFLGLLGEVRPFDVGVGTDYAFARIGLPAQYQIAPVVWKSLHELLASAGIDAALHTYTRRKQLFNGVTFSKIASIEKVASFELLLGVLMLFKKAGVPLKFSDYFDRAIGTHLVQQYINGTISRLALTQAINHSIQQFLTRAQAVCIYSPLPIGATMH